MLKKLIFITLFAFSSSGCATDLTAQSPSNKNLATINDNSQSNTLSQRWASKAQEVLIQALSLTGIEYKYGGSSPDTGFDCSGFVRYVFSQATQLTLPPTARAISQVGMSVKKDELQPGDLVFFNTLKSAFSHVGIYIGNNQFIHAPRTGEVVRVENMNNSYWLSRFNGAKRLDSEVSNNVTN
jgi:cell wall-associated NlpC family hydrolase